MTPSCAGLEFVQTLWEAKALKPELFTRWLWTPSGTEQVLLVPPLKAVLRLGASGERAGKLLPPLGLLGLGNETCL